MLHYAQARRAHNLECACRPSGSIELRIASFNSRAVIVLWGHLVFCNHTLKRLASLRHEAVKASLCTWHAFTVWQGTRSWFLRYHFVKESILKIVTYNAMNDMGSLFRNSLLPPKVGPVNSSQDFFAIYLYYGSLTFEIITVPLLTVQFQLKPLYLVIFYRHTPRAVFHYHIIRDDIKRVSIFH